MQVPIEGIARIVDDTEGSRIVGTAFLISPRHVMTCAHVINDALLRDWDDATPPSSQHKMVVDFPFAKAVRTHNCHVIEWWPPAPTEFADVAVLELDHEVAIRPYRTVVGRPREGQTFWIMGFPAGQDSGMDATGTLGSPREFGRLIAHGNSLPGFFITGGFSGAPLFDTEAGVVLGMAAEAARDENRRTAIIVPAEQLELIWPPLARPYKGLAAFQEGDSRFFFGRDRYIDELAEKLGRRPLVTVVGRSGSGKSSLIRAGLIPRLRANGEWRVVTFRPAAPAPDNPFHNLASAILQEIEGPVSRSVDIVSRQEKAETIAQRLIQTPSSIIPLLHAIAHPNGRSDPLHILLIADQFEELFSLVSDEVTGDLEQSTRGRFVQCLRAAADATRGPATAHCVLTLRADYLARALELRDLADALNDADVKLGPMTAAELLQVIVEPARLLRVEFEAGLPSELLRAVRAKVDSLPLLEFALDDLWRKQRDRTIHRATVALPETETDALEGPLREHANGVFIDLGRRFGEALFRKVLVDLVWLGDPSRNIEDTRRVRQKGEFSPDEWGLIEQLAGQGWSARLVALGVSPATGEPTAEIVHDALIRSWQPLRDWLEEDRAFRLWMQKIEEQAAEWRRTHDRYDLLNRRRLEEAEKWRAMRSADELSRVSDYIDMSAREVKGEDERWQQERRAFIAGLATLGASILGDPSTGTALEADTTLAVLLGASDWPSFTDLHPQEAFRSSADAIDAYLRSPHGLNLSSGTVLNLFDSDKSSIDQIISIADFIDEHRKQREVTDIFIYYVGHGMYTGDQSYHFAVRSTRKGHESITSIGVGDLARNLSTAGRAPRLFLIVDAAFAGAAFQEVIYKGGSQGSRSYLALCAGSAKEAALTAPGAQYTMFTGALLEVLRRGLLEHPRKLTFDDLRNGVTQILFSSYGTQVPTPFLASSASRESLDRLRAFPNAAA